VSGIFIIGSIVRTLLIGLIFLYRLLLRPHLCGHCRFMPHCSAYALQALRTQNLGCAVVFIGRRILQCHPWSKRPFFDPPFSGDNV